MSDSIPHLLNTDGTIFLDLDEISGSLESLDNSARVAYRDANADTIAHVPSSHLIIVAGPGTGKSTLFMSRIKYWIGQRVDSSICVTTFVKKLVTDLLADMEKQLTEVQRAQVTVSTLHALARSVLEESVGTTSLKFSRYIRVIDGYWATPVWGDVLEFHPSLSENVFSGKDYGRQMNTLHLDTSSEWSAVRSTVTDMQCFYNAVGFSDLIKLAGDALGENTALIGHEFLVVDEYQDFNNSEDRLIGFLSRDAKAILFAGDDEQALYQRMKQATPDIIIGHYNNPQMSKAMLPFCSRCSFYICRAAARFIAKHHEAGAIDKIYLPLNVDQDATRVQVVATTTPNLAVNYVSSFMDEHAADYETYLAHREAGEDKDPFLLILSANGFLTIHKQTEADNAMQQLVAQYKDANSPWSNDYAKVLAYANAGWHTSDNFAMRKVLHFEGYDSKAVHPLIERAQRDNTSLADQVGMSWPETLERTSAVCTELERDQPPDVTVSTLAQIVTIMSAVVLQVELTAHPIRRGGSRQNEDEAAVDSVNQLAPVEMMSIVRSKGLSAHHIMIVGCDNLNMPFASPYSFFVALTRGRSSVHIIASGRAGGSALHPFVLDLPDEDCECFVWQTNSPQREDLPDSRALQRRFSSWAGPWRAPRREAPTGKTNRPRNGDS